MNEMLNRKACPDCGQKTMIGHRQGDINPNPISKLTGHRVCLNCYMDSFYAKFGANG